MNLFNFIHKWQQIKKCRVIYRLGHKFFFDTYEINTQGVHITPALQELKREEYAHNQTNIHLARIIRNKRLDYCYQSVRRYERAQKISQLKSSIKTLLRSGRKEK